MLNTLPLPANQVSVQPPLSQIRMGATAVMVRRGRGVAMELLRMPFQGMQVTQNHH
jgi:hypothetical protein